MTRKQKYRQLLIILIWFMIIFTGFFSDYYLIAIYYLLF